MKAAFTATALLLTLAACDGVGPFETDAAPLDAQAVHPNGTVLQVLSAKRSGEQIAVAIRVMNGRDTEIKLNSGNEQSYILNSSGEKLALVPSPTTSDLAVPPGKMMDGVIVFAGDLPSTGNATLILNGNSSRDSRFVNTPRFEIALPLDGLGRGAVPATSGLSDMRALPMSRVSVATGGSSQFGQAGTAKSNLAAVEKLKSELGATESDRGTIVSLPGDVTFDFNKATVRADAESTLDQLAALIMAGGAGQIVIEGHTDAKGDDNYNKRLSEERANAVKSYLVAKSIDAARLKTIGLGELRPVAPNAKSDGSDDEAGRQKNRRVEVILPK